LYAEKGDIPGTLRILPKYLHVEQMILKALLQTGSRPFLNAISMVTKLVVWMFLSIEIFFFVLAASSQFAIDVRA
jgi:hypothetical protein